MAWLEKPISSAVVEQHWEQILGPIPDAPGLEDLDQLYPEDRIKPVADEGLMPLPPLPGMPALPLPGAIVEPLPEAIIPVVAEVKEKPKRRLFKLLLLTVLAGGGYLAYAYSSGLAPFA